MISKEEYKKLEIGDEVSIRGSKCTIFYFQDYDGVPVGILEKNAEFGLVAKNDTSQSMRKRYDAQIAAGYSPEAKSFRIFDYEVEKILTKAKDKTQFKILKKEDLSQLKIGDIVSIDNLDFKIGSLEVDGIKEPWINSLEKFNGRFPCRGGCHPQNKKLKLDFDQRYQSLNVILNSGYEVKLKTSEVNSSTSSEAKKEIYFQTLQALKDFGYDYGTSIFAELNGCFDEIELFAPDEGNFNFSKLDKMQLTDHFIRNEPSEFFYNETQDLIDKNIYQIRKLRTDISIELSVLSDVDIFDEEEDEIIDSTIINPQKNGVSADVFALYREFGTQKLKALPGFDLDKILENIKNKIYHPTGKKKISEKEAELLKRFGFTEKANVIEDSKENIMSEKGGIASVAKSDFDKAFWRSTAKNGTILLQKFILKAMKDKGVDRKEITYAKKFLESEFGRGFLSMALGYGLTYAPLPEAFKNNKHLPNLTEELRVGGMQAGMDTILAGAMEYVGPLLDQIKTMLPDGEKEITEVLPARIAKPTNKRIKASPKEDLDESEEEEVSEKAAKKA